MTQEIISQDVKTVLRRLKLGRMFDTLPERFTLARQQQMTNQDFLMNNSWWVLPLSSLLQKINACIEPSRHL